MIKDYVLDTNILLSNPKSIYGFDDNNVIITGTTLQELDSKKNSGGEIAYNARECIRILDSLREQGDLVQGISLGEKGILKIEPDGVNVDNLPNGFSIAVPDNRIISTCVYLGRENSRPVILVTNDISMRINASICGIKVEGYRNDQVEESGYMGHCDISTNKKVIDELYKNGHLEFEDSDLVENEFVKLTAGQQSALGIYRKKRIDLIDSKKLTLYGGIRPKNYMQAFAIWALIQPAEDIPLVILPGPAGCGKTFLSLAAGLDKTYVSQRRYEGEYNRVIISRPSAESYNELGYLPGSIREKTSPLLASFYDNAEIILSGKEDNIKDGKNVSDIQIDELLDNGTVEICALSFVRGRSLKDSYIICDEAQNASKTLIRDVITRAGVGTKVVLCGDPNQIDAPTLDKRNNGLTYAYSHMVGDPLCCALTFDPDNSVRSSLSKSAIQRMK